MRGREGLLVFSRLRCSGLCGCIVCGVAELVVIAVQQGQLLMALQAVDDQLFDDIVDNGEQRHTHDHTHKTPQAAKQQDGEQYPEAGQTRGVAQDLGADDVAVDLLQNDDEHDEDQALLGAHQQDQERAGRSTQERPEEGDHVGDAHHHAYQRRIGQ